MQLHDVVFLSPFSCASHHSSASLDVVISPPSPTSTMSVIAFSELHAIMLAVDTEHFDDVDGYQEASKFGKRYGNAGGVTASVHT